MSVTFVNGPLMNLKDIYQNKNVGIIQFVDNEQIRSSLFSIDGLNINIDNIHK